MNTTFTHTGTYVVETCYKCGIHFGMPQYFYKQVREDMSKTFYCPNGHGQVYMISEATRLRRQLDAERDENNGLRYRIDHANRSRAALKGQVTKIKRRVAKGICPCCRRNFANLKRHMEGQHPDWSEEE
ncbi:hypothetical protein LCGC14_1271120 [marine sediment metagenome]|uniref:Uncharacterized protein n=1 Tax=marine sediment metagenome TaxID=412755 RepID=A0A0F9KY54_9ZZZZ